MSHFDEQIKPKIQHEQKAEVKQEYKFLASYRLKSGMKLYKLDLKTLEYSEVIIKKKVAVSMEGKPVTENPSFLKWMIEKEFPNDTKNWAKKLLSQ